MKRLIWIGAFVAVFFLGAGAFAFSQGFLFSEPATASETGERIMEIAVEDVICDENDECETHAGTVQIGFEEADGLPDIPPDMSGVFVSQAGDTVTLGTGSIEVEVSIEQVNDNEPVTAVSAVYSGPEVQLIVNENTQVYVDVTPHPQPTPNDLAAGTMMVKHVVEAGNLSELGEDTMVRAWGTMQGDALVAEILVYEPIR